MPLIHYPHLHLGFLLLSGLLCGIAASRFNVPRVAAYVAAGILFSPALLGGPLGFRGGGWARPLTTVALAIIAYLIGGSMTVPQLKRMGRVIGLAALGETVGAAFLVGLVTLALLAGDGYDWRLSLAFAAIATTTAPAATIAVLHQYRGRGPMTSTLLGVVAVDDALGIIFFSVMLVAVAGISLSTGLVAIVSEIGGAVLIGAAGGFGMARFARLLHQGGLRLPLVLGSVLLVVGLAERWALSPLLAAMSLGFASRYFLRAGGDRLFGPIEYFEELVFIIFFTVAGTHFEIHVFLAHVDLVVGYYCARLGGKILGATWGARAAGAPPPVWRWLGMGLSPQAGVAVGLALSLSHHAVFAGESTMIINVVLATTMLHELTGPFLVRLALDRAGELGERRMKEAS